MKCSDCQAPLGEHEGIELWGTRFCLACFQASSSRIRQPLTQDQAVLLRRFARELAGYIPPDVLEMVVRGFWRRAAGELPLPAAELEILIGEIQRLVAFSVMSRTLNLLQTWKSEMDTFVEGQVEEIRETIRRLTRFE